MANLAYTYYSNNRAAEAVALMEDVVKSRKRIIGEKHPDTIQSIGSLRDWQRQTTLRRISKEADLSLE